MEELEYRAGEENFGAVAFGSGLSEGLRARKLPCGLGLGDALQRHQKDLAGALWVF